VLRPGNAPTNRSSKRNEAVNTGTGITLTPSEESSQDNTVKTSTTVAMAIGRPTNPRSATPSGRYDLHDPASPRRSALCRGIEAPAAQKETNLILLLSALDAEMPRDKRECRKSHQKRGVSHVEEPSFSRSVIGERAREGAAFR
jgi:hypothetical protein